MCCNDHTHVQNAFHTSVELHGHAPESTERLGDFLRQEDRENSATKDAVSLHQALIDVLIIHSTATCRMQHAERLSLKATGGSYV